VPQVTYYVQGYRLEISTFNHLERIAVRLALFQPDIAPNAGTIIRLCACLDVDVDIIEPCGFVWSDRKLRRAGMDYLELARVTRHDSWDAYHGARGSGRLVLLTTAGDQSHADFAYHSDDTLMLGRESAGVPDAVHEAADARLRVPMLPEARSLNVALAAAMVLGEALRQTGGFPAAPEGP
jgi:tRNA (cytidine/uridine-2'-O-)-methyltransferase